MGFSIVCEFGTHQNIPSMSDIKTEFAMTYKGALVFIKEAPLVTIRTSFIELSKFNFSVTDINEKTSLIRTTSTIDILDYSDGTHLGIMGMPFPRFGKLNSFLLDVFKHRLP